MECIIERLESIVGKRGNASHHNILQFLRLKKLGLCHTELYLTSPSFILFIVFLTVLLYFFSLLHLNSTLTILMSFHLQHMFVSENYLLLWTPVCICSLLNIFRFFLFQFLAWLFSEKTCCIAITLVSSAFLSSTLSSFLSCQNFFDIL